MPIRISRVYTRTGDDGGTHLVGGHRVSKDDLRIECYGTVDELNSTIGLSRLHTGSEATAHIAACLARIQNELFNLGSQLATRAEDIRPTQPVISPAHVEQLERDIDRMNADLPALTSFVLPSGGPLTSHLHLCRTVCRRAERLAVSLSHREPLGPEVITYLNRLSDALFVFARHAAHVLHEPEVLWQPDKPKT